MKEETYGWYPVKKPWTTTNNAFLARSKGFRHRDSRSNSSVGNLTPEIVSPFVSSPTHQRAPSPPKLGGRKSATPKYSPPASPAGRASARSTRSHKPSPPPFAKKAWDTKVAETGIVVLPSSLPGDSTDVQPPSGIREKIASSLQRQRAQSATVRKPKTDLPKRSIKSAGPQRSLVKIPTSDKPAGTPDVPESGRPTAPVPPTPSPEVPKSPDSIGSIPGKPQPPFYLTPAFDQTEEIEFPSVATSYEEQLDKYGWRMEIPGDPYNLKKPYLAPRLSFTVKCSVPEILPNPPTSHMENYDTYFYNTIPRKPLSYTIHQEWASEILHAKRMELQKRENGYNYRHTNYGFIY